MNGVARIALTGGIGSGKSTLARLLVRRGAGLIDSDAIARELTAAGGAAIEAIRAGFGPEYIDRDGAMDRARIRTLVFADPGRRRELEALLHPMIRETGERRARAIAPPPSYLVFDIPLLAESGESAWDLDRVLVIDCPVPLQIERVLERGQIGRAEIEAIISGQASRERRLAIADDIVFNAGDMAHLERCAHCLHGRYLTLRRSGPPM